MGEHSAEANGTEADVDAANSYLTVSEAEVDAANAYVTETVDDVVDDDDAFSNADAFSEADATEVDKYAIDEDASFSSPERKGKRNTDQKKETKSALSPARVLSPKEVYDTFLSPTTTTTTTTKKLKKKKKSGGTNSNLTANIRELVKESGEVEEEEDQDQDETSTRTPSSFTSSKG